MAQNLGLRLKKESLLFINFKSNVRENVSMREDIFTRQILEYGPRPKSRTLECVVAENDQFPSIQVFLALNYLVLLTRLHR